MQYMIVITRPWFMHVMKIMFNLGGIMHDVRANDGLGIANATPHVSFIHDSYRFYFVCSVGGTWYDSCTK